MKPYPFSRVEPPAAASAARAPRPHPRAPPCALVALASALLVATSRAGPPPPPERDPAAAGRRIVVIGAGYSGLAAACELGALGYDVTVLDRLSAPGGRAQRVERADGYSHDLGPSWYWMPEVFDAVLARFGTRREEYYNLTLLDPAYTLVDGDGPLDVPGTLSGFLAFAARLDPASDMAAFFADGARKYDIGMAHAVWDVPRWPLARWMFSSAVTPTLVTRTLRAHIARYAASPRLRAVLEWPSEFVGVSAADAPSLYALMTYAGHALGTWAPAPGGMAAPARALHRVALGLGVAFELGPGAEAVSIDAEGRRRVTAVRTRDGRSFPADGIVAAADYHHVEQVLLPPALRRHAPSYWAARVPTPGAVVFALCVAAPVPALRGTHTLFLDDADMPFYAHSDAGARADAGASPLPPQTSVFVLVPLRGDGPPPPHADLLAPVLRRLGIAREDVMCGADGYGPAQYTTDFHAWKGNAFGLANTLGQTMWLKPPMDSLAENLVFAGHLTHPGPGVPPALVSGVLAARLLHAQLAPRGAAAFAPAVAALLLLLAATAAAHTSAARAARALHRGGRTYFAAAAAMPAAEFARIAALYAAFRAADDLVDCTHVGPAQRAADLDAFAARQLATPASRLGYAPALWRTFFRAMRADAEVAARAGDCGGGSSGTIGSPAAAAAAAPALLTCATTAELVAYMDGSAAVLGEFMLPALGGAPALVAPARALGYAFQLTNMLRDVVEDARLGRQYVPADVCARHGLHGPLADADPADPRFRAVMEEMFALADRWYAAADVGIAALPARTRAPIALARTVYHRLHDAIRRAGYRLEPRVTVPWRAKLRDAAAVLRPAGVARMLAAEALLAIADVAAAWGPTACALLAAWLATEALDTPPGEEVSYGRVHVLWTLPVLCVLAVAAAARGARAAARPPYVGSGSDAARVPKWTAALSAVAVAYTTPWDAYLIRRGVWASTAVAGTLGGIPLEEFAFFVLATLVACAAWVVVWPDRWADAARAPRTAAVAAVLVAAAGAGAACVAAAPRTLYLGLLLLWAAPVLLLQWVVGSRVLAAHAAPLTRATLLGGGVLALVDAWAIRRNVWVLNPEHSLWPWAPGLHPEEVLFFLLAAAMCVGGLTLAVWAERGFEPRLRVGPWVVGDPCSARRHGVGDGAGGLSAAGGGGDGGGGADGTRSGVGSRSTTNGSVRTRRSSILRKGKTL